MRLGVGFTVALVGLTGCEERIDLDPVDTRRVIEADVRPRPISGGTLMITGNRNAVAADPDRDLIHVVNLSAREVRHTIVLEEGDEPGRVVEGSENLAHVVLRGFGGLATVDFMTGEIVAKRWLCPDPRGVGYDAFSSQLHVACADGTLLHLDETTGDELGRSVLEPDIRDVLIAGDGSVDVSRFRSASIVGENGGRRLIPKNDEFEAAVAWRTFLDPSGRPAMIHQHASLQPVPIEPEPEDVEGERPLPYGGGGGFCESGISGTAFSRFTEHGVETTLIPDGRLAVDAAMSPDERWLALAMPGAAEGEATAAVMPPGNGGCDLQPVPVTDEQVIAVAFDSGGLLVMQSREPARLLLMSQLPFGEVAVIDLPGDSRYDTGHEIFHRATEAGLSCASCHPEGTDDGHVWVFEGFGPRRTQPLDVHLADSAPFHWEGDMDDISVLVEEVLSHRMGGKRQSKERGASFQSWMFAQARPPADAGRDDPAVVEAGRELFAALDCGSCHDGPELGGRQTTPIRNVELQVPSLHRVSLRPPFMHDGRSPNLAAAVRDMIETTTSASPPIEDVEALTAYMRTL